MRRALSACCALVAHPLAFIRGVAEFRREDLTWSAPCPATATAYDWGRETAHVLTFRRWDF